ncbi:MAG: S-layer homology domain-containing protein [Chloroflexota bacterium]|nr:S-layer homology domain-containing protein [Chloroflexota bacterium]MDQ5864952.1 S-layer homology domain-containing protein [Chloroflexota bacterium]
MTILNSVTVRHRKSISVLLAGILAVVLVGFTGPVAAGPTAPSASSSPAAPEATCPPDGQCFADVPPGSPFYDYANNLYEQDIVSGYPCGGPGEPCDAQNRPYYRPGSSVTRAQMTKFVDLARTQPGIRIDTATHAQPLYSRTTAANGVGVTGASGNGIGVLGTSNTGMGVQGLTSSTITDAVGILGMVATTSAGRDSAGVRGRNQGTGGYGMGVWGSHDGAGPGVKGTSANGFGGEFTSDNYRGAYVRGGPSWIALYADGWTYVNGNLDVTQNAWITGDLSVSGTCTGCTQAYGARNSGDESLRQGDLVAAAGVEVDPKSGQPVLLVRRAGAGDAVIGVAGKALVRDTAGERANQPNQPLVATEGAAAPNTHVQVVVSGLTQVRVTTPDIKIGDALALGAAGGAARAVAPGAFARAVSTPDAQGLVWALVSAGH